MRSLIRKRYGDSAGPLATLTGEPGQARKGAAVVRDVCAGVWLVESPPIFLLSLVLIPDMISSAK